MRRFASPGIVRITARLKAPPLATTAPVAGLRVARAVPDAGPDPVVNHTSPLWTTRLPETWIPVPNRCTGYVGPPPATATRAMAPVAVSATHRSVPATNGEAAPGRSVIVARSDPSALKTTTLSSPATYTRP